MKKGRWRKKHRRKGKKEKRGGYTPRHLAY
jgi:hypothetical protein